jgi:hypothetical protein
MGEVADLVDDHRAAVAALVLVGTEHEVVDDQLASALEQIEQARLAVRALEDVVLLDPDPREPPALCSQRISSMSSFLFLGEQLFVGCLPLGG